MWKNRQGASAIAIYHLHAKFIGRTGGKSAVAAAAYRSTSVFRDDEAAQEWNYTRKDKAQFSEIYLPRNAPERLSDRGQLWNEVQKIESRVNSQFCREFDIALPNGLSLDQKKELVERFSKPLIDRGLIVDMSIHTAHKDKRYKKEKKDNDHFHLAHTLRPIDDQGQWGKNKDREIVSKEYLEAMRKSWADIVNEKMREWGRPDRIDHRTLEEQGITDRLPEVHQGPTARAIEMKGGTPRRGRQRNPDADTKEIKDMMIEKQDVDFTDYNSDYWKAISKEEQKLKTELALVTETERDWEEHFEKREKSIKNQELKAEAIATKEMIPYISDEWTRDIKSAEADIARHEREKPTPIYELKTMGEKLMSKIQAFQDDTGKEHKKHDDYVKAQTAIIQKWEKMGEMQKRKEAELRTEQNLIVKVKTQDPDYNELLKLSRYEKNRRPNIFESIMKKAKILLDTHPIFDGYRVFKKAFEQARDARAETKRREQGQKRGHEGHSR